MFVAGTEHGHIGYVRSFDDIAMDIWTLVTTVVQEQYPTKPVVIHGHCMGGAHAMRALQLVPKPDRPKNLAGVILSAPSYMIPPEAKPSAFILKALGCLACCVPSMTVADWPGAVLTSVTPPYLLMLVLPSRPQRCLAGHSILQRPLLHANAVQCSLCPPVEYSVYVHSMFCTTEEAW